MPKKPAWIAWALGFVLSLPAFAVGLHDDDFFQRLSLTSRVEVYRRNAWSLYEFLTSRADNLRRLQ